MPSPVPHIEHPFHRFEEMARKLIPPTPMTEYLLLNHGTSASSHWDEYFAMLRDKGHMIGGSALEGSLSVRDGTFREAISPTITGYIVIQARDLDEAKEIACQCPIHQAGGTVEVFTLVKSE